MNTRLDEIRARFAYMRKNGSEPGMHADVEWLLDAIERLTRERDEAHSSCCTCHRVATHRAETAEAEVATLRATLQRIEDLAGYYDHECADDGVAIPSVLPLSVARRLRAALRNEP